MPRLITSMSQMDIGDTEEAEPHDPALLSNVEVLELLQNSLTENQSKHKRWKHRDWVQEQALQYLQSTPCNKLDPSRREELLSILQSRKRRRQSSVAKLSASTSANAAAAPEDVPTPPTFKSSPSAPPIPDIAPSSGDVRIQPSHSTSNSPLPMIYNGSRSLQESSLSSPNPEASVDVGAEDLPGSDETLASGFGLTQAEALQILNFMPTEAVELHLLIEDLDSRLTQKQQDGLLETISIYTREPPTDSLASHSGVTAVTSGGLEVQSSVAGGMGKCNEEVGMGKLGAGERMNGH